MNRLYAIYARQSIDKPDSISIESQIERCRFEVQDHPHRVYFDRGYSGKNTDRPQFQTMLEAVRKGEIGCVICYKLDRCSRSILDFTQLMDTFRQYEVEFISCTEKFDTSTPMGRAMLNICIVFAQLERETIQQRISDAYHSRCKKGYFMGGRVPFGFQLTPHLLDGKKTSRYAVVEEEANILRRIYEHYQDPCVSLGDIILELKSEGIFNPRRNDGQWVRPHIGRMIKNPVYVRADETIYRYFEKANAVLDNPIEDYLGHNGCYCYRIGAEQHLVLAPHEGIIQSDVWLRCQKGVSKAKRISRQSSWLAGKLKCRICGRSVIEKRSISKGGAVYRYYRCAGDLGKECQCTGFKPFSAPILESAFFDRIKEHLRELQIRENYLRSMKSDSKGVKSALITLAYARDMPDSQLQQALLELSRQLNTTQNHLPCRRTLSSEHWERLNQRLSEWEHFGLRKKAMIADVLIDSAELSESLITIHWRI